MDEIFGDAHPYYMLPFSNPKKLGRKGKKKSNQIPKEPAVRDITFDELYSTGPYKQEVSLSSPNKGGKKGKKKSKKVQLGNKLIPLTKELYQPSPMVSTTKGKEIFVFNPLDQDIKTGRRRIITAEEE